MSKRGKHEVVAECEGCGFSVSATSPDGQRHNLFAALHKVEPPAAAHMKTTGHTVRIPGPRAVAS